MPSRTTRNRISLFAQGDHAAFREIFEEYYPRVVYFLTGIVKAGHIAEELAQDVFVRLWDARDRVGGYDSLGPYIYRMSRNSALNHLRHRHLELRQLTVSDIDPETPEDQYLALETKLMVDLAVATMPEQRKRVYNMSRVENLSNGQIAETLNITKKSVENHLNLALGEIRKILGSIAVFFI